MSSLTSTNRQMPKSLANNLLFQGRFEPGVNPTAFLWDSVPKWFDLNLARRGQTFAQKYLSSIAYSNMIGLYMSLGTRDAVRLLSWTGKSDTGDKAFNRYLATTTQIFLWFHAEIGDDMNSPFFTSLRNVRRIHLKVGRRVQDEAPDFSKPLIEEPEDEPGAPDPLWKSFRNDFSRSEFGKQCRESDFKREIEGRPQYYMSQLDMAQTLFLFAALPLLFKDKLGMADVDEEDWMGFVHLWAIIGHCLGISQDYNICLQQDLEGFKDVAQYMLVHNLSDLNRVEHESEVMWRAVTEAHQKMYPLMRLDSILVEILEDFLGVQATEVKKHLHYLTRAQLMLQRCLRVLAKFNPFRILLNMFVLGTIDSASKSHFGFSSFEFKSVAAKAYYY